MIPLFFTIDDNYAPFLAVALNSAIKNADKNRNYKAIVLHQGLNEENVKKLKALETDNFKIEITSIEANLNMLDDRMSNRLRCDYFTLTIYFRLFIPHLFPQFDKGIYIDSDVVVTDDLGKLFDIDLKDNYIGACNDLSIKDVPPLVQYTENAVGVKKEEYINSGVLLMNLKKMRENDLEGHFLRLLDKYHFDTIAPDQDYLNAICNGKILYLEEYWDVMPNDKSTPLDKTGIIHYNLFSKPWCYDNIQYGEIFWDYAKDSGFLEYLENFKKNYNKQEEDKKCMELLVKRGLEIQENDITFRKMLLRGEKIRL